MPSAEVLRLFDKYLHDRRLGARLESVSQLALATILTIFVESHLPRTWHERIGSEMVFKKTYENTSTALSAGTFTTKAFDFPIGVDFVVLENGHLNLLALVLDLLGGLIKIPCQKYCIIYRNR